MKSTSNIIAGIILLFVIFQSCTNENEVTDPEKVQFVFGFEALEDEGGRIQGASQIPAGTSLMISVERTSGTPVLVHYKVELLKIGDEYISEPIDFLPGQYRLTDFFLVTETSEVLFLVPRAGSSLASVVSRPLPYTFSVQKNGIKNIAMEVISTSYHLPEDFGYVSFGVDVINPFQLAVFTGKNGGLVLTAATAYILEGNDTVNSFTLGARINTVPFKLDVDKTYSLVVVKDGFARFSRQFIYNELVTELAGRPLEVVLLPAFSMVAVGGEFEINTAFGESGYIDVDWGDGSSETFSTDGALNPIQHVYTPEGKYFVSITGDLNQLTGFSSFYGLGVIDRINFSNLPSLTEVRFGMTHGPRVVDLSQNTKLQTVIIVGITSMEVLKLPTNNDITHLIIEEQPLLPIAAIDQIIHTVYLSVVHHRKPGYLGLDVSLDQLSPQSINELTELKAVFRWEIVPDPAE